ncbi:MAG: hypothetical protein RJB66_422 [Pseudomonadota bacterium]|jgi:hypothetical protein
MRTPNASFFFSLIFVYFGLFISSHTEAAQSYKINYNSSTIIKEHSVCKVVTNSSTTGLAIFVPTNSSGEWSSFYNSPSSGVTAASCKALDLLSVSSAAAFSLRKLRVLYTGAAIRVRNNNNNAEADISFDSSDAVSATSTATIKVVGSSGWALNSTMNFSSFYSGATVYVTIFYDQSGNNKNLAQASTANQPRIVNGGSLDLNPSSKIGIHWFDTTSRSLEGSAPMIGGSEFTVNLIKYERTRTTVTDFMLSADGDSGGRILGHVPWSDGNIYFDSGTCCNYPQRISGASGVAANTTNIYTFTNSTSANQKYIYVNTNSIASGAGAVATVNRNVLGSANNGMYHEYIIFSSVLSATDRSTLLANQKTFWSTP